MNIFGMILSVLLLAVFCHGGQASSNDNGAHRRTQRNSFYVFKNTPHGLLATWDQTQSRENCRDKHPSCPTWGHQGECHHNPNYMVPNCAYTCNTCLIGVSNNNGIGGNANVQQNGGNGQSDNNNGFRGNINVQQNGDNGQSGCINNAQSECDIVTRENSNSLRSGIIREAEDVFTGTVDSTDVSAKNASLTRQGALAGEEILMVAAESVGSSAREYGMGCRDLSTVCPTLAAQGNCTSNSAFMLVNCPISCNSCLPTEPSECVNKGDEDSCELSAILGLCEVNFAYNLRFCSGSCKMTQSLRDKCIRKPVLSCSGVRSLRTPDFNCGVPLNRRKRLAVSIHPAQSREARRLRKPSTNNRMKNNKRNINRNQKKNDSTERTKVNENENNIPVVREDISGRQSNTTLEPTELPSSRPGAICCSGLLEFIPQGRQAGCTGAYCDLVCSTEFSCECCDTRIIEEQEEIMPVWPFVFGLPLVIIPFLPGAPAVPAAAPLPAPPPPPPPPPPPAPAPPAPAPVSSPVTPIFPLAPIVPLIIAPVILAVPPLVAISGIRSIPDTVATRRAALTLLPFCDANSYLELVKQLTALTSSNTGNPLDPQVIEITRAIIHCRHGVGQRPPPLAANITIETGFGNISHTEVTPPLSYPGVSYPGLGEGIAPGLDGELPSMTAPGLGGEPAGMTAPGLGEELAGMTAPGLGEELAGIGAIGTAGAVTENDRSRFFCGAALITNRHVLTAAHCLVYESQKPEVIRLGERDFTTMEESRSADYNVKKITLHPEYNIYSGINDIAVIELDEEVTAERSGNLLPYCLPSEPQNLDGLTCTFSGWGTRPNALASTLLVNVNVTVRSLDECRALYNQAPELFGLVYPRGLDETILCAAGDEGEDACRGDSGGPLVLRTGVGNIAEEVGVVSQGIGCGDPEFPGIYTRTDAFLEWLDEVVYQKENEEICS